GVGGAATGRRVGGRGPRVPGTRPTASGANDRAPVERMTARRREERPHPTGTFVPLPPARLFGECSDYDTPLLIALGRRGTRPPASVFFGGLDTESFHRTGGLS